MEKILRSENYIINKPPVKSVVLAKVCGFLILLRYWGLIFLFLICLGGQVGAESINVEKLATAIYYAEGGSKTKHPYGILAHYKTTTPRQACINTIKHALKDWDGKEDFISFLGSRYCPVGAANDPTGLNKNWVRNVRRLYER